MENLTVFKSSQFGTVRTTQINGEPWFIASDVCRALEVKNNRDAISRLDEDEKGVVLTDTLGGMQKLTAVSESGLYSLVLGSRKPEAKQFKRWITHEVIPSIRKHGGYLAGQEQMSEEELMAKAVLFANSKIEELKNRIETMRPKEIFADAVSASDTSILIRDLAKILKQNGVEIGERRLWAWMREHGYICQQSREPTQRSMNLRLFEIVERTIERGDGNPLIKTTTKVTGKGQQYFINKFLNQTDEQGI